MMSKEEKINNSIVELDLQKNSIKGYCKKKDLKKQFADLFEVFNGYVGN